MQHSKFLLYRRILDREVTKIVDVTLKELGSHDTNGGHKAGEFGFEKFHSGIVLKL
jgi:hypothetical protein